MNCNKCGYKLDTSNKFCPSCGKVVDSSKNSTSINLDVDTFNTAQDTSKPLVPDFYKKKYRNDDNRKTKYNGDKVFEQVSVAASDATYEEETAPKKGGRIKSFFVGILITILLIGAASFAGYYAYNLLMGSSADEYSDEVAQLYSQINKVNSDMVSVIKKDTKNLAAADILKQASSAGGNFNKIISNHGKIAAPSSYTKSNMMLGEAIALNKAVYEELGLILSKPADPDTQKNMSLLSKNIDDCVNRYAASKISNNSIVLPDEILTLPSIIEPWVKQKQSEYAKITTLLATFTKYFEGMAKLFTTYDSTAAVDLNQLLRSVRGGQEKWDKLFTEIDNTEKIIKSVKDEYSKQSVPAELKTVNGRFGPILDDLLAYYSKLRIAAQQEQQGKDKTQENQNSTGTTPAPSPSTSTAPAPTPTPLITPKTKFEPKPSAAPTPTGTVNQTPPAVYDPNKAKTLDELYQEAEKHYQTATLNYQQFALDLKAEKDRYLDPEFLLKLKK